MHRVNKLLGLLAFSALSAFGYLPYSGYCEQGGAVVNYNGANFTPDVQASYPGCNVLILNPDGSTATIYADSTGTPKANPFTADMSTGYWTFWGLGSNFSARMSGAGIPSTFTINAHSDGTPGVALLNVPQTWTATQTFQGTGTALAGIVVLNDLGTTATGFQINELGTRIANWNANPTAAQEVVNSSGSNVAVFFQNGGVRFPLITTGGSGGTAACFDGSFNLYSGTCAGGSGVTAINTTQTGNVQNVPFTNASNSWSVGQTFPTITDSGLTAGIVHSSSGGLFSSSPVSLTADVSGLLPIANGGTGQATTAQNFFFAGSCNSGSGAPQFRFICQNDIPLPLAFSFGTGSVSAVLSVTQLTSGSPAILGISNSSGGEGIEGETTTGIGVLGFSTTGDAIEANSTSGNAIEVLQGKVVVDPFGAGIVHSSAGGLLTSSAILATEIPSNLNPTTFVGLSTATSGILALNDTGSAATGISVLQSSVRVANWNANTTASFSVVNAAGTNDLIINQGAGMRMPHVPGGSGGVAACWDSSNNLYKSTSTTCP